MSEEWDEDEQDEPDEEPDGLPDVTEAEQMWLRAAASYPLLTAEQEVQLGQRIAAGSPGLHCLGPWTRDALRARETLVQSNLRLIVAVAHHFSLAGTSFERIDLWQMGVPGLITAAERFDVRRGCKFSTMAYLWIRQAIGRAYLDEGYLIREPVHNADRRNHARRISQQLAVELERAPTSEELAAALGVSVEKVRRAQGERTRVVSLDKNLSHAAERRSPEDTETLGDRLPDPALTPEQQVTEAEGEPLLWEVVREVCTEREAWIVRRRAEGLTLEQIAALATPRVTRERIRQIESKALRKLYASLQLDAAGTLQRRPTVLLLLSLWHAHVALVIAPGESGKPRKMSRPAHSVTPPTTKNVTREPQPVRSTKKRPRRGTSSESVFTVLSSDESSMNSGEQARGERRNEAHRKGA